MIAATAGAVGDARESGAHSRKRRVLSVVHYPVFGGPHNLALRLAAPLQAHGWETIVLLPDEPGNAADRLRAGGVEVVTMPLHHLRAILDPRIHLGHIASIVPEVRAIRRLIRDRGIDLVQVAGLVNPQAAIAARFEHVPVVWQLLDTRAPWPVALASMAFVRELADAVMSTGRSVAGSHPGISAVEDRLVIFFPPVDVEVFRPSPETRQAVRAEWGVPDESPVVGCVANVNPQKGTLDLVRAFTIVRTRIPNARLILVGAEYPTHAAYSRLVHEAVIAGGLVEGRDVIFLDSQPDHERQLAGFDVFAFAPVPRGEGITTAVLEAMAAALPVVTSAVAGLPEAIESGVNGHLVPPLDPAALANAIVQILTDPVYAAQLGDAGRVRALDRFTTDRCVEDHLRAYEIALGRLWGERGLRGGHHKPDARRALEQHDESVHDPPDQRLHRPRRLKVRSMVLDVDVARRHLGFGRGAVASGVCGPAQNVIILSAMLTVHWIDDFLHRRIGIPYLRLTRERSIHERFRYALAVLDSLGLDRPTVLDVGCGSGILLRHLASHRRRVGSYIGIDLTATRLETRYRDVGIPHRFIDIDLDSDWRVPDTDFAWCSEVLEHLTDDRGVLRRIASSVRPGGYIVVTMPSLAQRERVASKLPSALGVSPTQDGGHVRVGYTSETLCALAADVGLAVVRIDGVSPRLDIEFVSRYRSPLGLMELIDRIPFARAPTLKFAAVQGDLERYISIAALLQRS